jgi:hypothetical protein
LKLSKSMPIDRNQIECWHCAHEMAADARFWLSTCSDLDLEQQLSPMGRPRNCCRVQTVAVVSPAEAAARMNAAR